MLSHVSLLDAMALQSCHRFASTKKPLPSCKGSDSMSKRH